MGKLVINSYDEFAAHLGEELGASDWLQVDQDRINLFADATPESAALHVGPDYRGSQHQDAGELRYDGYALWSACDYGFTRASGYYPPQHPEPAWHLQGRD